MASASSTSDASIVLWMTWQAMPRTGVDSAALCARVNLPDAPPCRSRQPHKEFP